MNMRKSILALLLSFMFVSPLMATQTRYISGDINKGVLNNTVIQDGDVVLSQLGNSNPLWIDPITNTVKKLPDNLYGHGKAVYQNRVYMLGGKTAEGVYSTGVYYWTMETGSLSDRQTNSNSMPANMSDFASQIINDRLYIIGGNQSGASVATVYTADVTSNGTVGVIQSYPGSYPSLSVELSKHNMFFYKGRMFVIGGGNDSGLANKIYYAKLKADGTYTGWNGSINLPAALQLEYAGCGVNGKYLYLIGGNDRTNTKSGVFKVDLDALMTDPVDVPYETMTSLPEAREKIDLVIDRGYVYVLGGEQGGTAKNIVYAAQIEADGELNNWLEVSSLSKSLTGYRAAAYNGYMYVFGGEDNSDILAANIARSSEGINLFEELTTDPLKSSLMDHSMVASGSYLYVLGGYDGNDFQDKVYYAKQDANGDLISWQTSSLSLPFPMRKFASLIVEDKLYIFGGELSSGSAVTRNYYTTLNVTTGELDTTWTEMAPFGNGRYNHSVVEDNKKVYIVGGKVDSYSDYADDVIKGTIGSGGNISSWALDSYVASVRDHESVIGDYDYMFLIGGQKSFSNLQDTIVQRTQLDANGDRSAAWDSHNSSGLPVNGIKSHSVLRYGKYVFSFGGRTAAQSGVTDKVYYSEVSALGLSNWTENQISMPQALYGHASVVLNGYAYITGGNDTSSVKSVVYKANLDNAVKYSMSGSFMSEIIDIGNTVTINDLTWTTSGGDVNLAFDVAGDDLVFEGYSSYEESGSLTVDKAGRYVRYHMLVTSNQSTTPYLTQARFGFEAPIVSITPANMAPNKVTQNTAVEMVRLQMQADAWDAKWNRLDLQIVGFENVGTVNIVTSPGGTPIVSEVVNQQFESLTFPGRLIRSDSVSNYYIQLEIKKTATIDDNIYINLTENDFSFKYPAKHSFGADFNSNLSAAISTYIPKLQPSFINSFDLTVPEADEKFVLGSFDVHTDLHDLDWGRVDIHWNGSEVTKDIKRVYIYEDAPNNAASMKNSWDEYDTLLSSVTVDVYDISLDFGLADQTITENTSIRYHLLVDLDDASSQGNTFNFTIDQPSDFGVTVSGTSTKAEVDTNYLPVESSVFDITEYASKVTIESYSDLLNAYPTVTQNITVNVMSFELKTDKSDATVSKLIFQIGGNADDIDVAAVQVYDNQGTDDFNWDANDNLLGQSTTHNSNTVTVILPSGYVVGSTTERLFVRAVIDGIADPVHNISFELKSGGIIFAGSSSFDSSVISLPQSTSVKEIDATIGDNLLYRKGTPIASGEVVQSDTDISLFSFAASTNKNAVAITEVAVKFYGTDPIGDIDKVSLYYKDEVGFDVLIAQDTDGLADEGGEFYSRIAIDNFKVDDLGTQFIVKVDIKDTAGITNTFNAGFLDGDGFIGALTLRADGLDSIIEPFQPSSNLLSIKKFPAQIVLSNTNPALTAVEKGNEYLFQTYGLNTISHTAIWSGLKVHVTGNNTVNDIDTVALYLNQGNDGWDRAEDTFIGAVSYNAVEGVTINFTDQVINSITQKYHLTLLIDSAAVDYDTVGLREETLDFIIDSESTFNTTTVLESSQPIVDPDPSNMIVSLTQVITTNAIQGQKNIPVMKLSAKMDTGEAHWNQIVIKSTGDIDSDTNISAIRIYRDNGDDQFVPSEDVSLGDDSLFNAADYATLALDAYEHIQTTTKDYWIVVDISVTSKYGIQHGFNVDNPSDITLKDNRDAVIGAFPLQSDQMTINVATIQVYTTFTDFTALPGYVDSVFDLGSQRNLVGMFEMYASQKWAYLENIVIDSVGTAVSGDISGITLYRDTLYDGVYSDGNELPIGSATFVDGRATINLGVSNPNGQINTDMNQHKFFVVVDVSDTATPGNTIKLDFDSFQFDDPNVVSINFPVQTSVASINNSVVDLTVVDISSPIVNQGDTMMCFSLQMKTNVGYAMLKGITLNRQGNAPAGSVDEVLIFKDDGDGFPEGDQDTIIASKSVFVAGKAYVALDEDQFIDTTTDTTYYWIALNVNVAAQPRSFLGLKMNSFDLDFTRDAQPAADIDYETTSENGRIADPPSVLDVYDPVLGALGSQVQGEEDVHIFSFNLRATPNWDTTLSKIKVKVDTAGGLAGDIPSYKVYKENEGNSVIGAGDILLGQVGATGGYADIVFNQVGSITVSTDPILIHIAADIDDLAKDGATYDFSIVTGNYFTISGNDIFPTQNLPIVSNQLIISATSDTLNIVVDVDGLAEVTQDTKENVLRKIDLKSETNSVVLNSIGVHLAGSFSLNDIDQMNLYMESTGDDVWSSADTLVDTIAVDSNDLVFNTAFKKIDDVATVSYYLLADVSLIATPDNSFAIKMTDSDFALSGLSDVVMPLDYTSSSINILEVIDTIEMEIVDYTASSNYTFYKGESKKAVFKMGMATNQHEAKWASFVSRIASGAHANNFPGQPDVERVAIYRDNISFGEIGVYDGNDILVGESYLGSQQKVATINFTSTQNVSTSQQIYFFVVDISTDAIEGRSLFFDIENSDIVVISPDRVKGDVQTSIKSIALMPGMIHIESAQNLAQEEAGIGITNNIIEKLSLSSNHKNIISELMKINLHAGGTFQDTDISQVSFYRDNLVSGNQGEYDEYDVLISKPGIKVIAKEALVEFVESEKLVATPNWYFLAVDIHPSANAGNTFKFSTTGIGDYIPSGSFGIRETNAIWETSTVKIDYPKSLVNMSFLNPASTTIVQGQKDAVLGVVSIGTNGSVINVQSISFTKIGNVPDEKIERVNIYRDVDLNNEFSSTIDIKVSDQDYNFNNSNIGIDFGIQIQSISLTKNYLIVADLADDVAADSTIKFELKSDPLFGLAPEDQYIASFPQESMALTINASADQAIVSMNNLNNVDLVPGQLDAPIMRMDIRAMTNFVELNSIHVDKLGTMPLSYIQSIKVYRDDGNANSGSLVVSSDALASDTLVTSINAVDISGESITINFATPERVRTTMQSYYLAVDILEVDASAVDFALSIASSRDIVLEEEADSLTGNSSITTAYADLANTVDEIVVTQAVKPAIRYVSQGSTQFVYEMISLRTLARFATFDRLLLQKSGTLLDQYVTNIQLYLDDGDEVFNPSPTQDAKVSNLTVYRFTGGIADISVDPQTISRVTKNYFVVVDVAADAPEGAWMTITARNDGMFKSFTVLSPDKVSDAYFNWIDHQINIVRFDAKLNLVINSDVSVHVSVASEFEVFSLEASTDENSATLQNITLYLSGEVSPNHFQSLELYEESGDAAGYDDNDIPIPQPFSFAGNEIFLDSLNLEITDTVRKFYIRADLDTATTPNLDFFIDLVASRDIQFNSEALYWNVSSRNMLLRAKTFDERQPTLPTINYSKFINNPKHLAFDIASEALNGIQRIEFCIGTTPGGNDILGWTDVDNVINQSSIGISAVGGVESSSNVVLNDIYLVPGTAYYISVKAQSIEGIWSDVQISDAIGVDLTPPSIPGKPGAYINPHTSSINVSWADSSDSESSIDHYEVFQKTSQTNWISVYKGLGTSFTAVPSYNFETYYFKVKACNGAGDYSDFSEISDGITYIKDNQKPGALLSDVSNCPNPFKDYTDITYVLNQDANVTIRIYDLFGNYVTEFSFIAGEEGKAKLGANSVMWDGSADSGRKVAQGGYIAIVEASAEGKTMKLRRLIGVMK